MAEVGGERAEAIGKGGRMEGRGSRLEAPEKVEAKVEGEEVGGLR